jgi:site-specific DNA-cytosine methylase
MKYLSLFSGIGGFKLGIQQAYEEISSIKKQGEGVQRRRESLLL